MSNVLNDKKMMTIKSRYIVVAAALTLLGMSSCKDFLETVPDTRVDIKSVEQMRELLVDGYSPYSYAAVGELSSDNVIDNNSTEVGFIRYNRTTYSATDEELYRWQDVKLGDGSDTPSGVWEGCYHSIAVANTVLERMAVMESNGEYEALSSADKDTYAGVKGEALLIRAYHHFILAQVFCMPYRGDNLSSADQGIPYMTASETTVKPHYERGTVTEVYQKIEADLLAGLPLINDGIYEVPKYHFNRAAANAFAARFYLIKRDYPKVVKYADAAFNGNDPATMVSTLWGNTASLYHISDLGRYYTAMARTNVFMTISYYSTWWRRFVSSGRYACNRKAKRATIEGPGVTWENCKWRRTSTNESFSMHPCFNGVCGTAGGQDYGTYFAGNCSEQFEYTDKIQGIGYCHMVQAVFTTEQLLLDRAEAKAFMGDLEGCVADLVIWDNARKEGVSSTSSMIAMNGTNIEKFYASDKDGFGIVKDIHIDEVYPGCAYPLTEANKAYVQACQHLRRVEQVHTGQRWFEIKRLGLKVGHAYGRNATDTDTLQSLDPRYAIQIPYEVVAAGMEPTKRITTKLNDPAVVKGDLEYIGE